MYKLFINIFLSSFVLAFLAKPANAQISKPGLTVGGSLLYAKPKGGLANQYRFGGGGEVFGGVGIGQTYLVATAGFTQFKPQPGVHTGALQYTPVKIGIKQFLFRKMLFVNADLGRATVKTKTFSETRFTRGIGVGVKLLGFEVGLYRDGWKSVNASGFSNATNVKIGWSILL